MAQPVEPSVRRKFQYTDLMNNNNKSWMIEFYPDGRMVTYWGRVGAAQQSKTKTGQTMSNVFNLVSEKIAKGYVELELHIPPVVDVVAPTATPASNKEVEDFMQYMFREAGQSIKSFLSVSVDSLNANQIARGKVLLAQIAMMSKMNWNKDQATRSRVIGMVEEYYNTIPSALPSRIDPESVARKFIETLSDHDDKLQQLQAAVRANVIQRTGNTNLLDQLGGVEINYVDPASPVYQALAANAERTTYPRYTHMHDSNWHIYPKVKYIFTVKIPEERKRYEDNQIGRSAVAKLYHGTWGPNVRHIVAGGLIIPKTAANGRRLGDGIYFADHAQRSLNYAGSNTRNWATIFVHDVALGKMFVEPHTYSGRTAPSGHDSVHGTNSFSGMDEFVVYSPAQQTLRAIIVMES